MFHLDLFTGSWVFSIHLQSVSIFSILTLPFPLWLLVTSLMFFTLPSLHFVVICSLLQSWSSIFFLGSSLLLFYQIKFWSRLQILSIFFIHSHPCCFWISLSPSSLVFMCLSKQIFGRFPPIKERFSRHKIWHCTSRYNFFELQEFCALKIVLS